MFVAIALISLTSLMPAIAADKLEKRDNQWGVVGWLYDYVGATFVLSGWTVVNRKREPLGFQGRLAGSEVYKGVKVHTYDVKLRQFGKVHKWQEGIEISGKNLRRLHFQRFSKHRIFYEYTGSPFLPQEKVATKARAVSETGKLLATASLKRYIKDELDGQAVGVAIEELHYNPQDGSTLCKILVEYELSTGFKRYETVTEGEKKYELFSVWPTER